MASSRSLAWIKNSPQLLLGFIERAVLYLPLSPKVLPRPSQEAGRFLVYRMGKIAHIRHYLLKMLCCSSGDSAKR